MAGTLARLVKIDLNRESGKLLLLFLVADLVLIVLHVLHHVSGVFADVNYSIGIERGFGETFQYLKEGWIALMLSVLAVRAANGLYAGWAVLFGLLLIDDLFAARERIGKIIGLELELSPVFGVRPQDLGELIVVGLAVLVLVIPLAADYLRGGPGARSLWRSMVVLLAALAAFGVVFDLVAVSLLSHPFWETVLGAIEEGGEMIVMSLIVRLVFDAWHGSTQVPIGADQ
ncbi:MAG: hypothetical protein ACRDG7_11790 [Candidatus Limnocylindria bacterium]